MLQIEPKSQNDASMCAWNILESAQNDAGIIPEYVIQYSVAL